MGEAERPGPAADAGAGAADRAGNEWRYQTVITAAAAGGGGGGGADLIRETRSRQLSAGNMLPISGMGIDASRERDGRSGNYPTVCSGGNRPQNAIASRGQTSTDTVSRFETSLSFLTHSLTQIPPSRFRLCLDSRHTAVPGNRKSAEAVPCQSRSRRQICRRRTRRRDAKYRPDA